MNWHYDDSNDESLRECWEEREREEREAAEPRYDGADALDEQMQRDGEAEDYARTLDMAPHVWRDYEIAEYEAWLMLCGQPPRMGPGSEAGNLEGVKKWA